MNHPWMYLLVVAFWLLIGAGGQSGYCGDSASLENQVEQMMLDIELPAGGLIVYVGTLSGETAMKLAGTQNCLLDILCERDSFFTSQKALSEDAAGRDRRIRFAWYEDEGLPYVDNLVNRLFVSADAGIPQSEIERVLVPGGKAYILSQTGSKTLAKPVPSDIDEWTHYLHASDNNAVARDKLVGPPVYAQWLAPPLFSRNHDVLASIGSSVSAKGRIFSIVDEGMIASKHYPPRWYLVARDAYNGVLLWKLPIESWEHHLRRFRSGPVNLTRRLIAVNDSVYATLGYGSQVTHIDARTGMIIREIPGSTGTEEILFAGDKLYLVIGNPVQSFRQQPLEPDKNRRIAVINTKTRKLLWKYEPDSGRGIVSMSLAADERRVVFKDSEAIVCLDSLSGRKLWEQPINTPKIRPGWSAPTVVIAGNTLLHADRITTEQPKKGARPVKGPLNPIFHYYHNGGKSKCTAYDLTANGKVLWECEAVETYHAPTDVFVMDNIAWIGGQFELLNQELKGKFNNPVDLKAAMSRSSEILVLHGRDLRTGKIIRSVDAKDAYHTFHHRCYRNKATSNYIILGKVGAEFVALGQTNQVSAHNWTRAECQLGVMPANGLLYVPPHPCMCFSQAQLNGFWAFASQIARVPRQKFRKNRLIVRAKLAEKASGSLQDDAKTWPTYRQNNTRSSFSRSTVPDQLEQKWKVKIGDDLSACVIAQNKVFLCDKSRGIVYCLNVDSGETTWRFKAAGGIDSPPTIQNNRAVFGCSDGWIYCLDAGIGRQLWQYLAAETDEQMVACDQVESVWPVSGSVLVDQGKVYATAGRSSYLDNGFVFCKLNLATGRELVRKRIYHRDPDTHASPAAQLNRDMPGALPDILTLNGEYIYQRDFCMDLMGTPTDTQKNHLFSYVGFLDDKWWNRGYWLYGRHRHSGTWHRPHQSESFGRILCTDGQAIAGFGRKKIAPFYGNDLDVHIFMTKLNGGDIVDEMFWSRESPLWVRGIGLTEKNLIIAGPARLAGAQQTKAKNEAVMLTSENEAQLLGQSGGQIIVLERNKGKIRQQYDLSAP